MSSYTNDSWIRIIEITDCKYLIVVLMPTWEYFSHHPPRQSWILRIETSAPAGKVAVTCLCTTLGNLQNTQTHKLRISRRSNTLFFRTSCKGNIFFYLLKIFVFPEKDVGNYDHNVCYVLPTPVSDRLSRCSRSLSHTDTVSDSVWPSWNLQSQRYPPGSSKGKFFQL